LSTLELKYVSKQFDSTEVIRGVSLRAEHGEFVVIVGPSGCGKSTLLRLIAGLELPSAGQIEIDQQNVNAVSAAHRGCAMVFQSYALYPHMTVYANMAFGLENSGVEKMLIKQKVNEAATLLRLDGLLDRKPTQLSGGQRQRVAIGRAIVREPKLFLFDEPLSNLDAELRVSMRAELRELHSRLGATMIYVTHDQVEAMTLASKIVVMRGGVIEQMGSPKALYEKPVNSFVAGFIGSPRMNFIPVALLGGLPGLVASFPAATQCIGIRPEHCRIESFNELTTTSALGLTITQTEYMGANTLVQAKLADNIRVEVLHNGEFSAQEPFGLVPDLAHLHCFDAQGLRISN
jgi:multiple sugar transport system ATP-binding protein